MQVEVLPVHRSDLQAVERFLAKEWTGEVEDPGRKTMRERNWMPGNESFGLRLVAETVPETDRGGVRCLLSVLEKKS